VGTTTTSAGGEECIEALEKLRAKLNLVVGDLAAEFGSVGACPEGVGQEALPTQPIGSPSSQAFPPRLPGSPTRAKGLAPQSPSANGTLLGRAQSVPPSLLEKLHGGDLKLSPLPTQVLPLDTKENLSAGGGSGAPSPSSNGRPQFALVVDGPLPACPTTTLGGSGSPLANHRPPSGGWGPTTGRGPRRSSGGGPTQQQQPGEAGPLGQRPPRRSAPAPAMMGYPKISDAEEMLELRERNAALRAENVEMRERMLRQQQKQEGHLSQKQLRPLSQPQQQTQQQQQHQLLPRQRSQPLHLAATSGLASRGGAPLTPQQQQQHRAPSVAVPVGSPVLQNRHIVRQVSNGGKLFVHR